MDLMTIDWSRVVNVYTKQAWVRHPFQDHSVHANVVVGTPSFTIAPIQAALACRLTSRCDP